MDIYIYTIYIWIYIHIYIYIYMDTRYQICQIVPGTRSCQVPDRARYQIVPGTASCGDSSFELLVGASWLQYLLIAKVTLVSEIPHGDFSKFDKILTKYVQKPSNTCPKFPGTSFFQNKKNSGTSISRKGLVKPTIHQFIDNQG
jgi:hypothetical protein